MLSTSLVPLALFAGLAAASNVLDKRQTRVYSNPVEPTAITGDAPPVTLTIITPGSPTEPTMSIPTIIETPTTIMPSGMPTDVSTDMSTDTTSMPMPVSSESHVTSAPAGGATGSQTEAETETETETETAASTPTPTFNPATKPSAFANPAVAGVVALAGLAIAL